ncbi:MAG: dockerin type I domain-containing protein, partial [Roseiflexaceae bacterium]
MVNRRACSAPRSASAADSYRSRWQYDVAGRLVTDQQDLTTTINALTSPFNPAPNVFSRQVHSSAAYDIPLPLTGTPGVECRIGDGGTNNNYSLILDFSNQTPPVTSVAVGGATIGAGIAQVDGYVASGATVTVSLSHVSNAQLLVVNVFGLQVAGVTGTISVPMHVLRGDSNADGTVNSGDSFQVAGLSGQITDSTNFRADVNRDGSINSGDSFIVRATSGTSVAGAMPALAKVVYEHDKDGNVTSRKVPGTAYDYAFAYDKLNRLQDIYQTQWNPQDSAYHYTYDPASNVRERLNNVNGTAQSSEPDEVNRLISRSLHAFLPNGGKVQGNALDFPEFTYREAYTYDPMNRLKTVDRDEDGQQDTFSYNPAGELVSATYGWNGRSVNYNLDDAGNRHGNNVVDENGNPLPYDEPDVLNQYTLANDKPVTNNPQHEMSSYDGVTYSYLNDSQLASA